MILVEEKEGMKVVAEEFKVQFPIIEEITQCRCILSDERCLCYVDGTTQDANDDYVSCTTCIFNKDVYAKVQDTEER